MFVHEPVRLHGDEDWETGATTGITTPTSSESSTT